MNGLVEWRRNRRCVPLELVSSESLPSARKAHGAAASRWLDSTGFDAAPGHFALLPEASGRLQRVLVGSNHADPVWALAGLPFSLPAGDYRLESAPADAHLAMLGWALGAYRFTRYRNHARAPARLAVSRRDLDALRPAVEAISSVRDLINTPTADMGPAQLAAHIQALGKQHRARVRQWVGPALLKSGFPTIHAVGRAATTAPRLIELTWGQRGAPEVVLVGKGVCFDTGGLNIKSGNGMRWMKKDMGGSAHAIGLAALLMQAKLPIHLRLLIPAVDNAIAGNAYRPGEVIRTRAGISVEVDNTDAEGRLVLCDALAYAVEHKPELIIDFATLTGAARVALGPDLPALFANRDELAADVLAAATAEHDPMWRLPLWAPYRSMLDSHIAETMNSASSGHAGAITAALYLQKFVPDDIPWAHVDVYSWNDRDRPGRPRGGEAQSLRAMFAFLKRRFGDSSTAP